MTENVRKLMQGLTHSQQERIRRIDRRWDRRVVRSLTAQGDLDQCRLNGPDEDEPRSFGEIPDDIAPEHSLKIDGAGHVYA